MNETQPALIECAGCNGNGCEECGDAGEIRLTTCPREYVTEDVWRLLEMAELTKRGLPPIGGGALDQAQKFLDGCRFVWAEEARLKAETLGLDREEN